MLCDPVERGERKGREEEKAQRNTCREGMTGEKARGQM